ncbi:Cytochrome P450 107B1 [Actinosynnema sp. ALI-1.44]
MTGTTDTAIPAHALFDFLFDHDEYRRLQDDEPVCRVRYFDGSPVWLVTRHEDVETVLKSPGVCSDPGRQGRRGALAAGAGQPPAFRPYVRCAISAMDPPDHTRLRKLVSQAFTARRVEELRPEIRRLADELLDDLVPRGEVDLLEEFAYPLPIRVICELLGVPHADREQWGRWTRELLWSPPERIEAAAQGIVDYAVDLIAHRRAHPAHDLLSALVALTDEGDRLRDDELVSMVITLLTAGHETTVHLISNGTYALLTNPDQLALLRDDPGLLPRAVDELLRYWSPADLGVLRFTTEPVDVGGVRIPAGEVVQLVYAAANRDPRRFADPQRVDVTRSPNPHLAFGHGPHHCLGAPLARAQGEIAFGALLRRCPDLALAVPPSEIGWRTGFARALTALPVRLGPVEGSPR